MQQHPGLNKFFYNLSVAARRVEERKLSHEELRGHLRKIKIVASQSPKKSVISAELSRIEKNLSDLITKRISYPKRPTIEEKKEVRSLQEKEEELDKKIEKVNVLLSKLGKKVDEEQFKKQLEEELDNNSKKSPEEELEEKLYELESKYYDMADNQKYPKETLDAIKDKISNLKEKIRIIRNK